MKQAGSSLAGETSHARACPQPEPRPWPRPASPPATAPTARQPLRLVLREGAAVFQTHEGKSSALAFGKLTLPEAYGAASTRFCHARLSTSFCAKFPMLREALSWSLTTTEEPDLPRPCIARSSRGAGVTPPPCAWGLAPRNASCTQAGGHLHGSQAR